MLEQTANIDGNRASFCHRIRPVICFRLGKLTGIGVGANAEATVSGEATGWRNAYTLA
jgi:hypothetical protein